MDEFIHLISQPTDLNKANFKNRLGKRFIFDHDDEIYCALWEISFSCKLKSQLIEPKSELEKDKLRLAVSIPSITGIAFVQVDIPSGFYTGETLVSVINSRLSAVLGPAFQTKDCHFEFNVVTGHIEVFLNGKDPNPKKRVSLVIFESMTRILGLQGGSETPEKFLFGAATSLLPNAPATHPNHAIAAFVPSLHSNDLFLVYLDCLKQQCVGYDLVQIADIFPRLKCVKGHSYMTYRVKSPKYIKVHPNLRCLSEIEVSLADEHANLIQFAENCGETRIALHFLSKSLLRH